MQSLSHNDLTIGWPTGWQDISTITLVGPPDGGFSPNISIARHRLQKPLSAEEYADQQELELTKQLGAKAFRVLRKGPFLLGPLKAYQRTQTFRINFEVVQLQVHIVKGHDAAVITCTDKSTTFEETLPIFKSAIAAFKWS